MSEIGMGVAGRQGYQNGYDDGLQEGERRGWEKGREAAAELMASNVLRISHDGHSLWPVDGGLKSGGNLEGSVRAAAIRKLEP